MRHLAKWYVYQLTHPVKGVVYIGKGCGKRIKSSLRHKSRMLAGIEAEIVANFWHEESAYSLEKQLIAQFQPIYNKSKGGDGGLSGKRSRSLSEKARLSKIIKEDKAFYANCNKYGTRAIACDLVIRYGNAILAPEAILFSKNYLKNAGIYQGISA